MSRRRPTRTITRDDPCLTVSTGHGASRTTFSATLPRTTCSSPVRPWVRHHDEIGIALPGEADDRVGGTSDCDLDFPGVAEGLRHEVTESRQRRFTVVTADNRRL